MTKGAKAIAAATLLAGATAQAAGPVVKTDLGAVRGLALGESGATFRGIPFAAPPIGALRWREAQPARAWDGIRDATEFGAICPQKARANETLPPQSEDCLTLTVVTPDVRAKNLPVLFSIHGGAFVVGSGRYIADQDLSPIVRRGVVLVSANYRIGRLGFLAHPALTAEAGRGTGNFWLSDQVAALKWVKRNIAQFGGDPGQLTILGCSAGGSSVNSLMTSPVSRGLFVRAGVHSGGGFFNATRPLALAEQQGIEFAKRAGVDGSGPEALAKLRALSTEEVLAADPGPPNYGAIIDGHFLPQQISVTFAEGRQARVPLIVGSTSNEASVFGMMGFDGPTLKARFGIDLDEVRPVYGDVSEAELLRRVQTDFLFTTASFGMAALASRAAPTWSYHFDYVPAADRARKPGASHCADMPYIFTDDARRTAEDEAIAAQQQGYWANFILHGDPNGPGLPEWPQVKPGEIKPLVTAAQTRVIPDLNRRAVDYWYAKWARETDLDVRP